MQRVHIASSRTKEVGTRCKDWALFNTPDGFEITDDMNECDIFISVMYDTIIPEEFISDRRCYNFHPGILPDFRGAGAFSWALLKKEKYTGITLHEIDKDIDFGPIIEVLPFIIRPNIDTAEDLFNTAMATIFTRFQYWFPAD